MIVIMGATGRVGGTALEAIIREGKRVRGAAATLPTRCKAPSNGWWPMP